MACQPFEMQPTGTKKPRPVEGLRLNNLATGSTPPSCRPPRRAHHGQGPHALISSSTRIPPAEQSSLRKDGNRARLHALQTMVTPHTLRLNARPEPNHRSAHPNSSRIKTNRSAEPRRCHRHRGRRTRRGCHRNSKACLSLVAAR